jgi:predicted nucleic acid-binding protein
VKVYFDTTVLVASSVVQHVHFSPADAAFEAVKAKKFLSYISAHGTAEFYSVMTRTPFNPRVFPHEAWEILFEEILPHFEIVDLSSHEYQEALRHCSQRNWTGGRIFDLLHIFSAKKAACDRIYTFNVGHFRQLAPELSDNISAP